MSLNRLRSATCQANRLAPIPPSIPYISLPDRHLINYFTQERIRKHLLQASLLTKDGRIVSEAEYASKQTDIAIGNNNQRKRDEAILQVLHELGEKQYKLANNLLEEVKRDLLYQFQRIEKQYARRTQPITIKVTHEGQGGKLAPIGSNPSDENATTRTNRSRLPSISPSDKFSNELKNVQEKLDELTRKQSNFEHNIKKQQELCQQTHGNKEKELSSIIDQQQIEQMIHNSTDIKNLHENITNIRNLLPAKPSGLTEADIDAAIESSEQRIIERITHKFDTKFQQLETQIAQLMALPPCMTRIDVEKSIHNTVGTIKSRKSKTEDSKTLIGLSPSHSMVPIENSRITSLETQVNDHTSFLRQLNEQINDLERNKSDHKIVEKIIQDRVKQINNTGSPNTANNGQYDPRVTDLQMKVNNQLESISDLNKKLEQLQQLIGESERRTKTLIENLLLHVHPDSQDLKLSDIVQQIHNHTNSIEDLNNRIDQLPQVQPDDELHKKIDNAQNEVKRVHKDLAALRRQLAQQSASTFQPSGKDLLANEYTTKDFQAIMPFIEVLPTFNLFAENEWD